MEPSKLIYQKLVGTETFLFLSVTYHRKTNLDINNICKIIPTRSKNQFLNYLFTSSNTCIQGKGFLKVRIEKPDSDNNFLKLPVDQWLI